MKLGIYCDSGINGGHEEMLKRLMLALVASTGIETLNILVPTANEPLFRYVSELSLKHKKVKVIGLTYTAESLRGNMIELVRMVRSTAAILRSLELEKLLIAQGTIASGLAGLFAARQARVTAVSYLPLVDEAPENAGAAEKIKWLIKRVLYRMPDEFVTLNEHLRGKLRALAPRARTTILENYVDDRFSRSTLTRSQARASLGLPDDGTTIIAHIGRLNFQQKRQDFLMQAIESHKEAFARTLVLIVGEGPDAERLEAIVEKSPALAACVRIVGPQKDVLPYIVASDTLVLPSAYEGVPLVMIEAVLAERPVVVSRVSGLESYLPDALLFPVDDSASFVKRVFSASTYSMAALTRDFRRRFSREVFDAQAQSILTSASSSRGAANPATREHSDMLAK
ncbi:glycosyltransferase [Caballeronia sp. LP006]|uniref:glycosyltransferase n=1 Tax=unclassified Caballeronia TaxID=2646786 RepID=UPI0020282784|nr:MULTISPECIES: glycosyltransferase [unclassified Caballeronia]MDR5776029.1 glycosyltransferase [Caballeronia sp. LZ002]MDR5829130.1 glycosyltransferase [Caballeronia sp. LP006]MDR5851469.1 glycosyltransferase [Caballeronia sp. LZ003]